MDRPSLFLRDTRTRGCLLLLVTATATALTASCTLITDVDRSKIPEPPVVTPDPILDAGPATDGGTPPSTEDAGLADAGPDAAGDAAASDAGTAADAQADGG
ncbi:MAG TPA: hypothetical protein VFS67_03515 [Polyangiaceae bacterium]|jgi:hypothetical protein|nr:hypothetical protein [Polyangiaceae bacterium]